VTDCCEIERSVLTTVNEDAMLCYVIVFELTVNIFLVTTSVNECTQCIGASEDAHLHASVVDRQ